MIEIETHSILLMEDNEGDARLVEEMLREKTGAAETNGSSGTAGANAHPGLLSTPHVSHAETLSEGLDYLETERPDVVLLDLNLPDSGGLDTLEAVLDRASDVPVIVLTGLGDEEAGVEAVKQGAQEYLLKDNVDGDTLVRAIRHSIERAKYETQLRRRNRELASLNEMTRDLLGAKERPEILERSIEAVRQSLDLPLATLALYDDSTGTLSPTIGSTGVEALDDETPLFTPDGGPAWDVFVSNERASYDDVREEIPGLDDETPLRSCLIEPVGRYGVLVVAKTEPAAFADSDVDMVGLLAATIRTTLDRVEREEMQREQKRTLQEKTGHLQRLERINGVIRSILQTLTTATTRQEIERAVCNHLGNSDPYLFAWIGEHDAVTNTVKPRAWAGNGEVYPNDITVNVEADGSAEAEEPTGRAVRTGQRQVESNLRTDPPFESWRREALRRGYRSIVAIPLIYEDSRYGVLSLYGGEPDAFSETEQEVLGELGEIIAYAINAFERKRALIGDNAVELEFHIGDPNVGALQLLQATNAAEFQFDSIVHNSDDTLRLFFTIRGKDLDIESAYEFAENSLILKSYTLLSAEDDELQFECSLTAPNIFTEVLNHGAVPQMMTAAGDAARLRLEIPQSMDVRRFVEMMQTKYDNTELVARRKRDRPIQTQQEFQSNLQEYITERQEETLRTAYWGGFFEWPRESTGEEIAEVLDVSQPTFTRHLRAAERNLYAMLFGDRD